LHAPHESDVFKYAGVEQAGVADSIHADIVSRKLKARPEAAGLDFRHRADAPGL
jgi:hypothetical protein